MPDLFNAPPALMAHLRALMPEGLHPTLVEMAEAMYLHLVEDPEAVEKLGLPKLAELVMGQVNRAGQEVGGGSFYYPKGVGAVFTARDREIVSKWNGRNKHQLAKEYGVTDVRIDQIISAWRKSEFEKRQGKLQLYPDSGNEAP